MERIKYIVLGLLLPISFGILRYMINGGDYFKNEILLISMATLYLWYSFRYARKTNLEELEIPTKKIIGQFLGTFLISQLFYYTGIQFLQIQSDSSASFAENISHGYSLSLMLSVSVISPIEEELFLRGFVQKGGFRNSLLGIFLTSSFFSLLHVPNDALSFIYYALSGFIYGTSYKYSKTLWVPILCHIGHNTIIVVRSFFYT